MTAVSSSADLCLPAEELERLADGVHDALSGSERHIAACSRCRAELDRIKRENTFLSENVGDLRAAVLARPPLAPDALVGYRIERRLSAGGQGVVYEAIQIATKRRVAVKMLREGVFATDRQRFRFEREVDVLASLRHPNIVTVFDRGKTPEGLDFVVMEFVHGRPIHEFCRDLREHAGSGGRLQAAISRCLSLLAKVASAVQHAHAVAVMHRDLKPTNILVEENGEPRVIDFGLARHERGDRGPQPTLTREFIGTSAYASPEQFSGNPDHLTVATDVYSLGVVMFEALTGRFPYPVEGSPLDVERHARSTDPTRPSSMLPGIPEDADTIVLKALSKDPSRRYASAGELAADINALLDGRPIAARRDSLLYRWRKQIVRHRVLAGAAVLLAVILSMWTANVVVKNRELVREQSRTSRAISDGNMRQARLLTLAGNTIEAEQLLWPELLAANGDPADSRLGFTSRPDVMRAAWGLFEAYSRSPRLTQASAGAMGVSPVFAHDGRAVSVFGSNGSLRTWTLAGEERPGAAPPAFGFTPDKVWVSPDASYVLGASGHEMSLADFHTGRVVATREDLASPLRGVVFSRDGSRFLQYGARLGVWRTRGLELVREYAVETDVEAPPALSPDGRLVAAWDGPNRIHVWPVQSGEPLLAFDLPGSEDTPDSNACLAISPDGGWLAAARGSRLCVWLLADPNCVFELSGHQASVTCCEFNADSTQLLSCAADRSVRVWDVGSEVEKAVLSPTNGVAPLASFGPDARHIAVLDESGTLSIWEARPGEWCDVRRPWSAGVLSVRTSHNGTWAVSIDAIGHVILWDVAAHKERSRFECVSPRGVCVLNDGSTIIWSAESGGSLLQWDGNSKYKVLADGIGLGHGIELSSDEKHVAFADGEKICLFDLKSCERRVIGVHRSDVVQVTLSRDGKLVASVGGDGECTIQDIVSGRQTRLSGHTGVVRSVRFSHDSHTLATGGDDLTVRLWDVVSGQPITTIRGMAGSICDLAFHPAGRLLFTCSNSSDVTIWDTSTGADLASAKGHGGAVLTLAVPNDTDTLVTGSRSGEIAFWDFAHYQKHVQGNVSRWFRR